MSSEIVEPLRPDHERTDFTCGIESLDRYLLELAGQELRRRTAAVFVLCLPSDPRVLGYYTLAQSSIQLDELPANLVKKLPRYPKIPATLLGRLAVDKTCKGKGYGEFLLMDALYRSWSVSSQIGSYAVLVDVLQVEPDPMAFYLRYGFQSLPDQPRRLFLTMETYRKAFRSSR